ncbi:MULTISPECIES: penicillin-binding protein 2 [unclassified Meiothermus]|uniref:peptidoglycan D,D-transpeptidase FtsI family protein n=1 Tax=unclassified Meiothermus TaxID=370471 RepID=UPI000D7BE891|nr:MULTISPECIES: penicillin-binding protein 2 [unclassified Meiothermus]PZA07795.1 penicillin-binding protein 2 [Meiothermus sp. Pnk-1]RYM38903.1 penicillin-binding protein 2 [Meiothermus sp. PNK-Is4]
MSQASLNRVWVVLFGSLLYLGLMGLGLYQLVQQSPRLTFRPPAQEAQGGLRGRLLASDGTPLAITPEQGQRFYPLGVSAAQVLGYGERGSLRGLEGLERDLEPTLSQGLDVQLTLDPVIQSLAERALWQGLEASGAEWGSALVMETKTGKLLAVANGPAFDPSAPRRDPSQDLSWRNHAFRVALEPGSTIKALTAATLLNEGAASLDTQVEAPMSRRIGGWTINDVVPHPKVLTLQEVLKYSSNVGISTLAKRINPAVLERYFTALHFNDPEPMAIAKVAAPRMRPASAWSEVEYANHTFGQGFLITPLHLTAAYNALANDGDYVPPTLFEPTSKPVPEPVFRPEVARRLRSALAQVVVKEAQLPGYQLGGKTGTAQVVVNGRYSNEIFTALFAGFLPAQEPRATVVVVVYYPKGGRIHGAWVAAPIFRQIAAGLFAYWGVPPAETTKPGTLDSR